MNTWVALKNEQTGDGTGGERDRNSIRIGTAKVKVLLEPRKGLRNEYWRDGMIQKAKISSTPCDKKFQRWLAKEIREIYEETDTKEDFRDMLLFVMDNVLKSKTTAILQVEELTNE